MISWSTFHEHLKKAKNVTVWMNFGYLNYENIKVSGLIFDAK